MNQLIPPTRSKNDPADVDEGPRAGLPGMFVGLFLGGLVCGGIFWLFGTPLAWVGVPVAGWTGYVVRLGTPRGFDRNPRPPNVLW
jgi:hypothetical protein